MPVAAALVCLWEAGSAVIGVAGALWSSTESGRGSMLETRGERAPPWWMCRSGGDSATRIVDSLCRYSPA